MLDQLGEVTLGLLIFALLGIEWVIHLNEVTVLT